jgi:preprotein translocase subunit SecF
MINLNIPFMSYRNIATMTSLALLALSILSLGFRGLNLGLDFSGGTLIEVTYSEAVDLGEIRDLMTNNGFDDFQVVNFGSDTDVLIKVADKDGSSQLGDTIFTFLQADDPSMELQRIEFVGPQVGSELRDQGGLGMLVALGMILLYVAFRFQYKFALGAVTALAHDVVIILGLFSLFAWDFDLTVLAALLAVIGYSLNDTIVVSDRIRENFRGERGFEPEEIINRSINQTLSRTLITSFTTLLVLLALYFFGGDMIRGFSEALIIGVLVGTYSSIYVVANMLLGLSITQDDLAIPEAEGVEFDEMP